MVLNGIERYQNFISKLTIAVLNGTERYFKFSMVYCSVLLFVIVEGGGFIIIYHSIIGIYDLLV